MRHGRATKLQSCARWRSSSNACGRGMPAAARCPDCRSRSPCTRSAPALRSSSRTSSAGRSVQAGPRRARAPRRPGVTAVSATACVADSAGNTHAAAPAFDQSVTTVAARIRAFMVRSSVSTVGFAHRRGRRSPCGAFRVQHNCGRQARSGSIVWSGTRVLLFRCARIIGISLGSGVGSSHAPDDDLRHHQVRCQDWPRRSAAPRHAYLSWRLVRSEKCLSGILGTLCGRGRGGDSVGKTSSGLPSIDGSLMEWAQPGCAICHPIGNVSGKCTDFEETVALFLRVHRDAVSLPGTGISRSETARPNFPSRRNWSLRRLQHGRQPPPIRGFSTAAGKSPQTPD